MIMASNRSKTERIDIRTDRVAKQTLQRAAAITHRNVSEFLLEAGLTAAEEALADRRRFVIDDAHWKQFQRVLNRPVRGKPRLARLLSEPSAIE